MKARSGSDKGVYCLPIPVQTFFYHLGHNVRFVMDASGKTFRLLNRRYTSEP